MIRSTKNEGISSLSKRRFVELGLINDGVGGESFEAVEVLVTNGFGDAGTVIERRDAIDDHDADLGLFPSNSFNGTFE